MKGKKILIVDDNIFITESYSRMLRKGGFVTEVALNGCEAMHVISRSSIDLVILDLDMPVKNGFETLMEIKESNPWLPVIVVTGQEGKETKVNVMKAGASNFFTKPVDIKILRNIINQLLIMYCR
ncbi:MAG: response regulator [Thermodesulfobacteriota bacterium]|nr:response regulator [Thermodesulfobacteriota bacterium]